MNKLRLIIISVFILVLFISAKAMTNITEKTTSTSMWTEWQTCTNEYFIPGITGWYQINISTNGFKWRRQISNE